MNELAWNNAGNLFFMATGPGIVEVFRYNPSNPDLKNGKPIMAHTANIYCIEFDPTGK